MVIRHQFSFSETNNRVTGMHGRRDYKVNPDNGMLTKTNGKITEKVMEFFQITVATQSISGLQLITINKLEIL